MTKRENFLAIRELVVDHQELVDFIDHEVELLDKKRTTPRKPTKTQQENDILREDVYRALKKAKDPINMEELFKACEPIKGLKTQRVTHLLTKLIDEGRVERTIVKKVRYYQAIVTN